MTVPGEGSSSSQVDVDLSSLNTSQQEAPNSQLVNQVFSLFKGYLSLKVDERGTQLEETARIGKEFSDIKFKGNRKQFELNSRLDNILTQIAGSVDNPTCASLSQKEDS